MENPNDKLPSIPLKRYFSVDELCHLAQVSEAAFADWQMQHGCVLGSGGRFYSRQDVLFLRKVRFSLEPKVSIDPFTEGKVDEAGDAVLTAVEVRIGLGQILSKLDTLIVQK